MISIQYKKKNSDDATLSKVYWASKVKIYLFLSGIKRTLYQTSTQKIEYTLVFFFNGVSLEICHTMDVKNYMCMTLGQLFITHGTLVNNLQLDRLAGPIALNQNKFRQ